MACNSSTVFTDPIRHDFLLGFRDVQNHAYSGCAAFAMQLKSAGALVIDVLKKDRRPIEIVTLFLRQRVDTLRL